MTAGPRTSPDPNGATPRLRGMTRPVVKVSAPTERRNPRTAHIDDVTTLEVLTLINAEDKRVPDAVSAVLEPVAVATDLAVTALRGGRRVHYFGAGTSGRLGFLDAAELLPTYNVPAEWFCPHQAGGTQALWRAVEEAEDDADAGYAEAAGCVRDGDVVVGLAASGRTPYVLGALRAATAAGAATVLVTANPQAEAASDVDVFVGMDTGPEAIAGSTRMKAATAQKLVLNAFSTAVMVQLGRVYSNLMVSMVATNAKLRGRMLAILTEATGLDEPVCEQALLAADGELKTALVTLLADVSPEAARTALAAVDGRVRDAITRLAASPT